MNAPRSLARPRMLIRVLTSALKRTLKRIFTRRYKPSLALSPEAIQQLQALSQVYYEQAS